MNDGRQMLQGTPSQADYRFDTLAEAALKLAELAQTYDFIALIDECYDTCDDATQRAEVILVDKAHAQIAIGQLLVEAQPDTVQAQHAADAERIAALESERDTLAAQLAACVDAKPRVIDDYGRMLFMGSDGEYHAQSEEHG